MGRNRTRLILTATDQAAIASKLKTTRDARLRERLMFLVQASTGEYTLEDLGVLARRQRSTIQNWLQKYNQGGIGELIRRDSAPGKASALTQPTLQAELKLGLANGRWLTAQQVADWLSQEHGTNLSRKSIYYWFNKFRR